MANKFISKVCYIIDDYAVFIGGNIHSDLTAGDTCIVLKMRTDCYFVTENDCYMIVLSKAGLCEVHTSDLEIVCE